MISKGDALCLNLVRMIPLLRDLLETRCCIKYQRYGLSVFESRCSWGCLPGMTGTVPKIRLRYFVAYVSGSVSRQCTLQLYTRAYNGSQQTSVVAF